MFCNGNKKRVLIIKVVTQWGLVSDAGSVVQPDLYFCAVNWFGKTVSHEDIWYTEQITDFISCFSNIIQNPDLNMRVNITVNVTFFISVSSLGVFPTLCLLTHKKNKVTFVKS